MRSFPGQPSVEPALDVIVVGAGIIGCSVAFYLAQTGRNVLVLERDQIGAGPSHVAPGMLAPQVEAHYDDAFFALTLAARAEHAPLAALLRDMVGIDVECRATGALRVAADEAERAELRRRLSWQQARGLRVEWLEPENLGACEPLLQGPSGRRLLGGLWFPDEAQVRAVRLVRALALASARQGVRFLEGIGVQRFMMDGSRVKGVHAGGRTFSAESFVVTAGVGSADLGESVGITIPVRPVKGQVIHLQALDRAPAHILWAGHCYLVPRVDGEVVLGATEEDGNDDPRPTLAGLALLATEALELVPTIGAVRFATVQGGLRPATPDRYPIIGWAPTIENLLIATEHFRAGILLGPLTGKYVAQMLNQGAIVEEIRPFGLERLASVRPKVLN